MTLSDLRVLFIWWNSWWNSQFLTINFNLLSSCYLFSWIDSHLLCNISHWNCNTVTGRSIVWTRNPSLRHVSRCVSVFRSIFHLFTLFGYLACDFVESCPCRIPWRPKGCRGCILVASINFTFAPRSPRPSRGICCATRERGSSAATTELSDMHAEHLMLKPSTLYTKFCFCCRPVHLIGRRQRLWR